VLVFISWSGAVSEAIATALAGWLPRVIQAVRPWVSTQDLQKGQRWAEEISAKLEEATFGIFCLTPDNLDSPWLLFEAGAISKLRKESRVCTYLLNVRPNDIRWPLAMFQATETTRKSTFGLVQSINAASNSAPIAPELLKEQFNLLWPSLEEQLAASRGIQSLEVLG
jgi:hypothetical protein